MGRYFGREPRYTREEIERQAQEAIDARIALGRPPEEDFLPLEPRLAEIDRVRASCPPVEPVPAAEPLRIHHVRVPPTAPREATAAVAPKKRRQPVAARPTSN